MFDATKLQRKLPHLADYGKDVDSWMTDFVKIMELYDIMEPRRIFIWVKEAVEEDIQGALQSLVVRRGDEMRYPTFKEIQNTIEEHLHITENDKCAVLKTIQINQEESIKKFNYRYKKLYNKLSLEYRRLISVKDYTNAISSRVFPCSRVMVAECDTINEACKIAEVAEETEKEIANINQRNEINNMRNHIMFTQNQPDNSLLMRHPFYENLQLNQLPMNHNNNIFQERNNWNSKSRLWNNNNNFRNSNYVYHMSNPYNNPNYYLNNTNDINKMNNGNFTNRYNSRFNYNKFWHSNNINQYMNNNNKYNMNNMNNNQPSNEIRDNKMNHYLNNLNNNINITNNDKEHDNQMFNNNKFNTNNMIQSFNYQNGNNHNNGIENNNVSNTLVTNKNSINNNNNNHVNCYRCTMNGHRASECPYTFKQLAELEEKGLLNKHLNQ